MHEFLMLRPKWELENRSTQTIDFLFDARRVLRASILNYVINSLVRLFWKAGQKLRTLWMLNVAFWAITSAIFNYRLNYSREGGKMSVRLKVGSWFHLLWSSLWARPQFQLQLWDTIFPTSKQFASQLVRWGPGREPIKRKKNWLGASRAFFSLEGKVSALQLTESDPKSLIAISCVKSGFPLSRYNVVDFPMTEHKKKQFPCTWIFELQFYDLPMSENIFVDLLGSITRQANIFTESVRVTREGGSEPTDMDEQIKLCRWKFNGRVKVVEVFSLRLCVFWRLSCFDFLININFRWLVGRKISTVNRLFVYHRNYYYFFIVASTRREGKTRRYLRVMTIPSAFFLLMGIT